MDRQTVADGRVQRRAQARGFVQLGDDAAGHVLAHAIAVGVRHLVQRVALAGGVEHQQAAHRLAGVAQHRGLLGHVAIALADAGGVDQHDLAAAQLGQQATQLAGVAHRMRGHAHEAAVDLQLLQRADPEIVRRQHGDLVATLARDAARGQLRQGGGLAHAGGTDQRIHASAQERILRAQHRQVRDQFVARPGQRGVGVQPLGHALDQRADQLGAETRVQQTTEQRRAGRLAAGPLAAAPEQAVHAAFQRAAQGADRILQAGGRVGGQGPGGNASPAASAHRACAPWARRAAGEPAASARRAVAARAEPRAWARPAQRARPAAWPRVARPVVRRLAARPDTRAASPAAAARRVAAAWAAAAAPEAARSLEAPLAAPRAWRARGPRGAACNGGISMRTGAAGAKGGISIRTGAADGSGGISTRTGAAGADAGIMPASSSSSGSADAA